MHPETPTKSQTTNNFSILPKINPNFLKQNFDYEFFASELNKILNENYIKNVKEHHSLLNHHHNNSYNYGSPHRKNSKSGSLNNSRPSSRNSVSASPGKVLNQDINHKSVKG